MDCKVTWLSDYGFTRTELTAMVEDKLKAHIITVRRVPFPDEVSAD